VRVNGNREPEVARQVATDLVPRLARVITPHHVPMFLHEQHARTRPVHREVVNTVADFSRRVGEFVLGLEAVVNWPPRLATIVGAECALITKLFSMIAGRSNIASLRVESTPILQLTSVRIPSRWYRLRTSRESELPADFSRSWIRLKCQPDPARGMPTDKTITSASLWFSLHTKPLRKCPRGHQN